MDIMESVPAHSDTEAEILSVIHQFTVQHRTLLTTDYICVVIDENLSTVLSFHCFSSLHFTSALEKLCMFTKRCLFMFVCEELWAKKRKRNTN